MNPRFTFLPQATVAALLAAAALPALGQLYQPVGAGSASDVTGAALIPDFSGIWARFFLRPLSVCAAGVFAFSDHLRDRGIGQSDPA
jgi:hypothetical protein